MRGNDTRFDQYLADEITKYKGIAAPVKASLLRRLLVRNLPCKKLRFDQ